jgi:uncharacterized protein YkwD
VIVVIAIVLVSSLGAHPVVDATKRTPRPETFRARLLELVNQTRARHGLPSLALNRDLSSEDWWHSVEMGRRGGLFHTEHLESLLPRYGATRWGENIGYADTLVRINELWMLSPDHRDHLLDAAFDHVGIGVAKLRGWLWVTMDLYG